MRHVADVHAVREGRAVGRVMLQANTLVVSCDICDRLHHLDLHVLPLGRIELIDVPLPGLDPHIMRHGRGLHNYALQQCCQPRLPGRTSCVCQQSAGIPS